MSHIAITPQSGKVTVIYKGAVVAESTKALSLKEGSYPATIYVPRADIRPEYFLETDHKTVCPHKGTARYWSLNSKDGEAPNAVWGYDNPKSDVAAIDQHVAFYPNQVEIRVE
jgi:uncharacterized protein (DUF427 family)